MPKGGPVAPIRRCFRCGHVGPLADFEVNKQKPGGHGYRCRRCKQASTTKWRRRIRRWGVTQFQEPHNRAAVRRWQESNPEKVRAHQLVAGALKKGALQRQPCERCGASAQAHHDDYARPLEIRWLCARHHRQTHGIGVNAA